jgi:arylsulfatase A-like enzyme
MKKFCLLFIVIAVSAQAQINHDKSKKPNIIYILADDLGYGDLSCYGQTKFSTPNIDKLAKEGLLFSQHYSGSTVCAPSRSSLMTGQHTGYTPIRGNKQIELPKESFTIAELLKQNGYTTGGFGKWGLGTAKNEGSALQQGFDTFFGYYDQGLAHHYYPDFLWDDDEKVILNENSGLKKGLYAPTIIHQKALSFIDKNKDNPFFLYYPTIIPHAELFAPEEYMQKFKGKFDPEKAFKGTDEGDSYKKGSYGSQEYCHAAFVAMITLLDDQVGEIVQKVKDLGLEENTIFLFTSDNGPHKEGGAAPIYFNSNGNLKGHKRDLFEGGIRVPMIVKWKGKIKEGSKTDLISAFWDIMPTISQLLKSKASINSNGISFLPTLLGEKNQAEHESLYWEFHELGGRQALRKQDWKLIKYDVSNNGKYQLYNLKNDLEEENDLANKYPDKVIELAAILESSRTKSKYFNFGK